MSAVDLIQLWSRCIFSCHIINVMRWAFFFITALCSLSPALQTTFNRKQHLSYPLGRQASNSWSEVKGTTSHGVDVGHILKHSQAHSG